MYKCLYPFYMYHLTFLRGEYSSSWTLNMIPIYGWVYKYTKQMFRWIVALENAFCIVHFSSLWMERSAYLYKFSLPSQDTYIATWTCDFDNTSHMERFEWRTWKRKLRSFMLEKHTKHERWDEIYNYFVCIYVSCSFKDDMNFHGM